MVAATTNVLCARFQNSFQCQCIGYFSFLVYVRATNIATRRDRNEKLNPTGSGLEILESAINTLRTAPNMVS